jgi:hypothetical protein
MADSSSPGVGRRSDEPFLAALPLLSVPHALVGRFIGGAGAGRAEHLQTSSLHPLNQGLPEESVVYCSSSDTADLNIRRLLRSVER